MSSDEYKSPVSNNRLANIPHTLKCEICDHIFTTRYNLKRHNETFHDVGRSDTDDASEKDERDESMSEVESSEDAPMSEEENSSDDTVSSDDDEEEEDEDSSDNYATNIFRKLIMDVYSEHEDQLAPLIEVYLDKNVTKKEALIKAIFASNAAKKTLRRLFTQSIFDIKEQIHHPLYKAINKKAKEYLDDGLDEEEAIISAVSFRKHGINNLIKYI